MNAEEIVLTGADLKQFIVRHAAFVCKGALVLTLCTLFFFLTRPLHYKQEASLRALTNTSTSSSKLQELLPQFSGGASAEGAIAILQSKRILSQVVDELGLQAFCKPDSWLSTLAHHMQNRILFDLTCGVSSQERFPFRHVVFAGQEPLKLLLRLTAEGEYELWDRKRNQIGHAKVGSPLIAPWGELTLTALPTNARVDVFYPLKIYPPERTLKYWRSKLKVFPSKQDKQLVQLEMVSTGRHLGAQFLNTWMQCYETFICKEQEEIYQVQIHSLQEQSQELSASYQETLRQHAHYLDHNLQSSGGFGCEEEGERFSSSKQEYLSRLSVVDLELKRLRSDTSLLATSVPEEFSDLTVPLASELLLDYNRKKQLLQSQVHELQFLKHQIQLPHVDISSIGGVFEDAVTRELVSKASVLALQLQDTANRSPREQERLLEEIASQKNFLSQYLTQTLSLKTQKMDLLQEKMSALKFCLNKLLQSEHTLLHHQLDELKGEMQQLPQQWYHEAVLTLKKEQVAALLKGVEQLISSLHLSKTSAKGCVKPLDRASIPEEPQDLHLWTLTLIALLLSSVGLYAVRFFKEGL